MRFDLRIPIGGLFLVYGVVLSLYGVLGDRAQYVRSLGMNINLACGIGLLILGGLFLLFAYRRRS